MERRQFLKSALAAAAGAAMSKHLQSASGSPNPARLPRRPYGHGRVELSIVGFGGMLVKDVEPDESARLVAEAVEKGVNYFDVAPTYGDAEIKLGPALDPYRKDVFLACKTTERSRAAAEEEFNRSLQRLRTDYFDLYQLHAITDVKDDVEAAFAPGGVMELLTEAKRDGRVRHLGFSAHSVDAALAAMDRYDFDSILFPINFTTFHEGDFGPRVIAKAQEKGVSRLALKALAKQKWSENHPDRKDYPKCWYEPVTDRDEASLALRFTLSQPVTAAIPPGQPSLWRMAVDLAMTFEPLTESEQQQVEAMAEGLRPIFKA
jgi:predicted aldo/keto reductase-like oxidoreductase